MRGDGASGRPAQTTRCNRDRAGVSYPYEHAALHNDDQPPTPTYIDAQSQAVVECGSAWDTLDKA
ncbi:MAG: hypothetical protein Tsb0020_40470 [Haliangiales bacterium]